MKNTFAISVNRVLEGVYAFAALDFLTVKDRPDVLGRGQARLLRRIVSRCAATLIAGLVPAAIGSSITDDADADIITIDFELPEREGGYAFLRPALEAALAAEVMHIVWASADEALAGVYAEIASGGMAELRSKLLGAAGMPGRISPAA